MPLPWPVRRVRSPLRLLAVLLLLGLAGCGGSDGGTDPQPQPTISITVAPASVSVEQGEQVTVTISLTRGGGYAGSVAISLSGLPAGVTPTGPGSIAAGASQLQLTLQAAAGATVGSGTVTVTASGAGVSPAQATFTLEVTQAPVGTFALSLDPSSLSVGQGSSGSSTVTVDRSGGFAGPVALSVSGAPAGVSATPASSSVTGTSTTLEVTVGAGVAAGAYTLTVTGTGQDTEARTAELALTVTAAATTFDLSLDPASVSVQQGAVGSTTVEVDRSGGFQGTVELSVTGAPAGLDATLGETSLAGASTTLDVAAGAGLAPDTYTLTVTGTGTGAPDRSAELSVTVTATASTEFVYSTCDDIPDWLAIKDGSGSWERVPVTGAGPATFSASSDRIGIAAVTVDAFGDVSVAVLYVGPDELRRAPAPACPGQTDVPFTVSGLGAQFARLTLGGSPAFVPGPQTIFEDVPLETVNLVGARLAASGNDFTVDRLLIRRGITPPFGTVSADFTGADAFDPVVNTVTVTGQGGDEAALSVSYWTDGRSAGFFPVAASSSTSPTRSYPGVPASRQEAGDLHQLTLTALSGTGGGGTARTTSLFFVTAEDRQIAFGPELGPFTIARSGAEYTRQAEYDNSWFASWDGDAGGTSVSWTVLMSDDYHGAGSTVVLDRPDLAGADGWNAGWELPAGTLAWSFTALGLDGEGLFLPVPLTDGAIYRTATTGGDQLP